MPKTHHATRRFRLSCGCLRDYPGMAAGKRHDVLCTACGKAVTALFAYPERCCGTESAVAGEDQLIHLSCTNAPGNSSCGTGVHYDEFHKASFRNSTLVRRGAWGNTGRS